MLQTCHLGRWTRHLTPCSIPSAQEWRPSQRSSRAAHVSIKPVANLTIRIHYSVLNCTGGTDGDWRGHGGLCRAASQRLGCRRQRRATNTSRYKFAFSS